VAKTVLVVEDDLDMQHYFRIVLSGEGLELVPAGNGAEALEVLDSGRQVDLILLDMVMPVMNGEEFFRSLRVERKSSVPVIFSSVDETRAEPLKSIGRLDGIFLKGRPSKELLELIHRTLG
jgi:CheY-like chemotaxis protein